MKRRASGEAGRRRRRIAAHVPDLLSHLGFAALGALILAASAQPLQTDDAWWHLALGEAYAVQGGPRLASDPLLHTAVSPPAPAAWLADLALAWSLLRRASASRRTASLLAGVFAALSAYRLYQLRPELATILLALVLYRLVLESPQPPSRLRVGVAAALLGLWANLHSGFALGPILLAAACGGCLLGSALGPPPERRRERARARRLALLLALGLLATLATPDGIRSHVAYLEAGRETPELTLVVDEWARVDLLRPPAANLPPSPLAWGVLWALILLVPATTALTAWRAHRTRDPATARVDPALAALAAASLVASLIAVRFLWLGIFPLLLVARNLGGFRAMPRVARKAAGLGLSLASLLLVAAFVEKGDWRMLSGNLPRHPREWLAPYAAAKYHASAVGVLSDSGIEGNLYNDYFMGGFLGYWLAPRARAFVNGSLNLPIEALSAYGALGSRQGERPGESFVALLDRYRIDVFLGVRLPVVPRANRPWIYTTAHLERCDGWLLAFRAPASAVYVRAVERNRANIERLAAWYAREGVPFDPERGFDVAAVIRQAPDWAVAHGVIPRDHAALLAESESPDPLRRREALERLATLDVSLGLYEQALAIDARLLRADPRADAPRRRLVWSLLRLGRLDDARREARALALGAALPLSRSIAAAAQAAARVRDPDVLVAGLARLPVFTTAEARELLEALVDPPTRPYRR